MICICCNKSKKCVEVRSKRYRPYHLCKKCFNINKDIVKYDVEEKEFNHILKEVEQL